jgi:DNA-binding CsgD family transcriptional regulator
MSSVLEPLSPREAEVLRLLARGTISNRALAAALLVSEWTIHSHLTSLYAKLDASSKAELVVRAYSSGLVPLKLEVLLHA